NAYFSEHAPSTASVEEMVEESSGSDPNTRVMLEEGNMPDALNVKETRSETDGRAGVTSLTEVIDIKIPLELIENDILETYYKNDNALFTFEVEEGKEVEATDAIYEVIGEDNALAGDALDVAISQKATGQETFNAAAILVPIVILI